MSRIGKMPVPVPDGVDIAVSGQNVTVTGPRGTLARQFHDRVTIELEDGQATVTRKDDERQTRALHGLSRALLANMVTGVTTGFRRDLEIAGVGYRVQLKGTDLELSVGFSHLVKFPAPLGIGFEVPEPTKISVLGIDKERVGQAAAEIRGIRPPEPYKGKGIRYVGEQIRRKTGKAGR